MISGALAAISGHEATLRMDTTSPGKKWVPETAIHALVSLPYLNPVSGMLLAAKHNCQHSSKQLCTFTKHFQTGSTQPSTIFICNPSKPQFFHLSKEVGNLSEVIPASKRQSYPIAAQGTQITPLV